MTLPRNERAVRLAREAIAFNALGDRSSARQIVAEIYSMDPQPLADATRAFAATAAETIHKTAPEGASDRFALHVADPHGVDGLAPAQRFALRLLVATLNRDEATVEALLRAEFDQPDLDRQDLALGHVFALASDAARNGRTPR